MQLGSNRGSRLRRIPHFASGDRYKSVLELMVTLHGTYRGPGSGEAAGTSPLSGMRVSTRLVVTEVCG